MSFLQCCLTADQNALQKHSGNNSCSVLPPTQVPTQLVKPVSVSGDSPVVLLGLQVEVAVCARGIVYGATYASLSQLSASSNCGGENEQSQVFPVNS